VEKNIQEKRFPGFFSRDIAAATVTHPLMPAHTVEINYNSIASAVTTTAREGGLQSGLSSRFISVGRYSSAGTSEQTFGATKSSPTRFLILR